ncbi:MAG TPA: SDR family oxidoreductase [Bryobacteraceae bacterium]|nr:SDR family oxidoreductase [Bryobacteraceae bacterium]
MTDKLFSVEGKVVLVSGGSRGIGLSIAQAFQQAGAKAIVSSRHEDSLKATGLEYRVCDITDAAQIARSVDDIAAKYGRLDALFNVAGINFRHVAETYPEDKLDEILAINVRGNFLMARDCGRVMIKQGGGKIVNIASLHTHVSLNGMAPYAASKGSIGSMTRALAVEWAQYNVQVNAIAPGMILTDLNAKLWENPTMLNWVVERTPARRLGKRDDLVGAAIFLASAASDFVTGQVLYVDGGLTAGQMWPLEVPR